MCVLSAKGDGAMTLQETISSIQVADATAISAAYARQASLAKPLGGLGRLEDAVCIIAGAQHTVDVNISKRAVVVFCADNGVVRQGVSQSGQEITATVTENMAKGQTTVCIMAKQIGMDVMPVNIGVAQEVLGEGVRQCCVRRGTNDFTEAPAMTRDECINAMEIGIALAEELARADYTLLATGEMGIGNTTTSAAVASVLLQVLPHDMTGRGAGLSDTGLKRKISAIERGIALHKPKCTDCIDVVSKVGGLDLAGMIGLYLGAAAARIPVVIDGFISIVAALCAVRMCPAAQGYLLASHVPSEPGGQRVLQALGMQGYIDAGMHLGEGTGAVAAVSLFDMAVRVYQTMITFDDTGIVAYQPQND